MATSIVIKHICNNLFITLGVITFGVALYAKSNNAKCNNLIVPS